MRIIDRWLGGHRTWAIRRSACPQAPTEETSAAEPGAQDRSGAEPRVIRALELDQEQAHVVLAALEDAAVLGREAIGNCPDCRSAADSVCADHQGSWETAEEYDALRWHLDDPDRDGQADQEAGRPRSVRQPSTSHLMSLASVWTPAARKDRRQPPWSQAESVARRSLRVPGPRSTRHEPL